MGTTGYQYIVKKGWGDDTTSFQAKEADACCVSSLYSHQPRLPCLYVSLDVVYMWRLCLQSKSNKHQWVYLYNGARSHIVNMAHGHKKCAFLEPPVMRHGLS